MKHLTELGKGVKAGITKITPEQAIKMLKSNNGNRAIKKSKLSEYILDMQDGLWQLNGVPIIFDKNGSLIDGQNRLHAVIKSGITTEFLVVTGIERKAFETVDTGANRSAGDILSIIGLERTKATTIASLIQKIHNIEKGRVNSAWSIEHGTKSYSTSSLSNTRARLTNTLVKQYYLKHKQELDDVYEYCSKYRDKITKVYPFKVYIFAYYLLRKISVFDANYFFEKLATGEMLREGNPIYTLRERLIKIKHSDTEKVPTWHYPAMIYKAWNYYRKCKELKGIKVTESEPVKPI